MLKFKSEYELIHNVPSFSIKLVYAPEEANDKNEGPLSIMEGENDTE